MKVSVLLPTYNRASTVGRAIESYLNQDYKDTELIVLNDNSSDGTMRVLNRYESVEGITILNSVKNYGPPNNMNFLWSQANGDLICQLHDDDEMTPDSISKRVELFKQDPTLQVAYGGAIHQNLDGQYLGTYKPEGPYLNKILERDYINFTTLMYRKDIPFKFEPTLRYQFDWLFKIKCLRELKVGYTPDPVMKHSLHEGQETSQLRKLGLFDEETKRMRELL